jgi:hypothetical protein
MERATDEIDWYCIWYREHPGDKPVFVADLPEMLSNIRDSTLNFLEF